MKVFFTADTHFGDHRTINISRRPFANAAEMDEALVARCNAVVGADDVVWHLGDVARRPADVTDLLARLNGTKHLLRGNNDPDATLASEGWTSVADCAEIELDGRPLVLHLPKLEWTAPRRAQFARPQPRKTETDAAAVRRRRR